MFVFYPLMPISIFMRRRPLARAAVVGGAAYYAGRRARKTRSGKPTRTRRSRISRTSRRSRRRPRRRQPPASGGMAEDSIEKLKQLADLHTQGVLTDAEFEVQKQKILQGM